MDDILKDGYQDDAQTSPISLNDLVEIRPLANNAPQSAIRNRAATSAILSGDPNAMVEKYRLMLQEGAEGKDVTIQDVQRSIDEQNRTKNMRYVINIMGDPSIPLDQKKQLMNLVQTNQFKEEPAITLQDKALSAPSTGEDLRGESARISLASTMADINKDAQYRQKAINSIMADAPDASLSTVGELAQTEVMPFGRNVIAAKVAAKVDELSGEKTSTWKWVKRLLLPGSTEAEVQQKLLSVPHDQRGPITDKIKQAIKESASVFPSENYYAQWQEAMNLLDSPTHSNGEIWAKNLMTVLDMFWVGGEARALMGVGKAAKAAKTSQAAEDAAMGAGARRPGSAAPGVEDVPFEEVHKADWEIVGDPYNPMQIGKPKDRIGTNPAPKALPSPEQAKKADIQKRIELNAVMRRENPVTPYSVIEQANPAQARAMADAITKGGDEVAQAFTGVDRDQALANMTMPQVGTDSGAVLNKVKIDIEPIVTNTGALRYTPEEYAAAVGKATRDFRGATEMEINDAMTTFRTDGDHLIIDAHYSPVGGSWTTPEAAKAQAGYALRGYGIKEDEIIVMKRDGMDYVPVGPNDTQAGDYIIKIQSRIPVTDDMVESWNPFDVKRNWADKISQLGSDKYGTIAGSMFDPGSMLHGRLTGSFAVAEDQSITLETQLLKPIKEFRDAVSKLPKERRILLDDYIQKANKESIKFDSFKLMADGLKDNEIEALKKWKDIWDTHYYLENYDLMRTLRSQGFMVFENKEHRLFGKPIQKNQNIRDVYDPKTNSVRSLPKDELDALYNLNGSLVQLRRPVTVDGVSVEHMIVRNTPGEYMRAIRETDPILNYREGYYTRYYEKGSKFIDEISVDTAGKEVRRTVAVAGSTKDAEMFSKAQAESTGNKYVIREDSRGYVKDGDGYWDVNSVSGRIAQRFRGKPLEDAIGVNELGKGSYVVNPMESAVRAAKSLSGRTSMRPVLETAKKRFVEQYAELIPKNEMGMREFPESRGILTDHSNHTSKLAADARTTWDYINMMENGYINIADDVYKGAMRILENEFAKYELSTAEKAARKLGNIAPTHAAKSTVFNAYIAASLPMRQWLVQGHQATRMIAYNPLGIPGMGERFMGYLASFAEVAPKSKNIENFIKFVEDSGMVDGVDRNSLIRGMGLAMADSSSDIKRAVGAVLSAPQKFGFDIGEKFNQLGHLAAVHEKWTREGKNLLDKTVRDAALAEARALGYDLNRAGEFHYTQGSAAAMLQFLQMPHKGLLQYTNRKIDGWAKIRLATWDTMMWGVPGIGILSTVMGGDILPDDQDTRDKIKYGAESWGWNYILNSLDDSGEKTRVDFSSLAPYDLDGWARMYHTMVDQGAFKALSSSPVGQMLAVNGVNGAKRNGRVPQAIITMGRFFNVFDEIDPENPTQFTDVLNDVAKISSAWNAYSQSKLMLETRKKLDGLGNVTDEEVTVPEIWMQAGGFGKLSTKELYDTTQKLAQAEKDHKEQVLARYRDIASYYTNALQADNADIKHITAVSSMLMRTFDTPEDQQIVLDQWKKDMQGKHADLLRTMMKAAGAVDSQQWKDQIRMAPISDEEKQMILNQIQATQEVAAKLKSGK